MNHEQRVSFLTTSRMFGQTPLPVVEEIAAKLRLEVVPVGGDVFQKGETADRMFLLVAGQATVHEGVRVLRTLQPGDGFGELAMLDEQPRAATITALEPCTLLSLDREGFNHLVASRPEVSRAILKVLASNLRSNTEALAKDYALQMELEQRLQEQLRSLAAAQLAVIFSMSKLAESRDTDTGLHLERVREYCRILALELAHRNEFSEAHPDEFVELVYRASPLHDIGKVAIPDSILLKPGRLTPEEFAIMKTHTDCGARTLRQVAEQFPGNRLVSIGIEIAEGHHEKWDGSGYPQGKSGLGIPLSARIVAVADVYDALTSRRPYKEPFPPEKARALIVEGRGVHFDPVMVDAFLAVEPQFLEVARTLGDGPVGETGKEPQGQTPG